MDSPPDNEGQDRRSSNRVETKRPTFFSTTNGGSISQGTVIDISASGMCIRTHNPAPKGSEIDIEMRPKSTSGDNEEPIYARGIVRWTKRLPDGAAAMGVRLRRGRPGGAGPSRGPSLDSRWLRKPPRGFGQDMTTGSGVEVRFSRAAKAAAARKHKRSWWPLLLLLLVCSVTLLTVFSGDIQDLVASRLSLPDVTEESSVPSATPEVPPEETSIPLTESQPSPQYESLDTAYTYLEAGRAATARAAFQRIATDPLETLSERFAARIGEAESLAAQGDRNEALATLDDAIRATEGIAEPWRKLARDLQLQILSGERGGGSVLFARVLEFAPITQESVAASTEHVEAPPPPRNQSLPPPPPPEYAGIHLRVSTARNILTVYEGDRTLGTFPVGLGRNQSTPHGNYQVVNKILEPDWYYEGRVVKADDPENPLGGTWVGLSEDGERTPYGIHGTNEPSSIGLNLSRGCIRMLPDDARKLFEWVDIGTPVKIVR